MKVIVDCNIVISAGLSSENNCRKILNYLFKYGEIFICEEIINEYFATITKDKLQRKYADLKAIILEVLKHSQQVYPTFYFFDLPDKKDEIYLQAAFSCEADYLITGNIKHFPDKKYGKTKVVTPREFLTIYKNDKKFVTD